MTAASVHQSLATVFVVDDDPAVVQAVELLIRALGLPVRAYGSAPAFLDDYKAGEPGCLILDLHMPEMNGAELLEALAAARVHLPAIIMTATPDHPLAQKARVAGAAAVLAKPVKPGELQGCLERALRAP